MILFVLLWILLTVSTGSSLLFASLWVKRTPLWWFAVNWFRLIWGTRHLGVNYS
jgi:hypothetical protein